MIIPILTCVGSIIAGVLFIAALSLSEKVDKYDWFAILIYTASGCAIYRGVVDLIKLGGQ